MFNGHRNIETSINWYVHRGSIEPMECLIIFNIYTYSNALNMNRTEISSRIKDADVSQCGCDELYRFEPIFFRKENKSQRPTNQHSVNLSDLFENSNVHWIPSDALNRCHFVCHLSRHLAPAKVNAIYINAIWFSFFSLQLFSLDIFNNISMMWQYFWYFICHSMACTIYATTPMPDNIGYDKNNAKYFARVDFFRENHNIDFQECAQYCENRSFRGYKAFFISVLTNVNQSYVNAFLLCCERERKTNRWLRSTFMEQEKKNIYAKTCFNVMHNHYVMDK